MAKAKVKPLADAATVARYIGYSKLRRDKHGAVTGVLHTAFELRPATVGRAAETYLSAAQLDVFPGDRPAKLKALVKAYDPHPLVIRANGAFTLGQAGRIKASCQRFGRPVRIVNAPKKNLDCYVEVRQFKSDVVELLQDLADQTWCDVVPVGSI